MIPLVEQRDFISENLSKLGAIVGFGDLSSYADELDSDDKFKLGIESKVSSVDFFQTKHWDSILRLGLYRLSLYALTRASTPEFVVETGVLHGLSSAFLLSGLRRNDAGARAGGRLVSIDAPSTFDEGPVNNDGYDDTLPPGLDPGWAVSDDLRALWDLKIGTSQQCLPSVLNEVGKVDLFVHDSEHTYETMLFEFQTIWPFLSDGGLLLADNIDANTSFFDFACDVRRAIHVSPVDPDHRVPGNSGIRFGVLRK